MAVMKIFRVVALVLSLGLAKFAAAQDSQLSPNEVPQTYDPNAGMNESPTPVRNVPKPMNRIGVTGSPEEREGSTPGSQTQPAVNPNRSPSRNQVGNPQGDYNQGGAKTTPYPQDNVPQVIPPEQSPVIEPPVREQVSPQPVVVPDSRKSEDQRSYESSMRTKLDSAVRRIEELKATYETLSDAKKEDFLSLLRLAEGNRAAARIKLNQMKSISPNDWRTIQKGIDEAFYDLEKAVDRAQDWLAQRKVK